MKLRIEFERDVVYHEKSLTLQLMRYFKPTKLMWLGTLGGWSKPEVIMEGGIPTNPFEVMELIKSSMRKEIKDWSCGYLISSIEMESPEEKEQIDSWILVDKLKGNP